NADFQCCFRSNVALDRPLSAAGWNEDREDSADGGCEQRECVRSRNCCDYTSHLLPDCGVLNQSRYSSVEVIEHNYRPGRPDSLLQGFGEPMDISMKQET